jgi:hypothetical protein
MGYHKLKRGVTVLKQDCLFRRFFVLFWQNSKLLIRDANNLNYCDVFNRC